MRALLLAIALTLFHGCTPAANTGGVKPGPATPGRATPSPTADPDSIPTPVGIDGVELPEPPAAAGQLIFSIPDNIDPASVKGYVVGYPEELTVQKSKDGDYFLNNIPAGNQSVVVVGSTLALGVRLADAEPDRGIRLNGVKVLAGVRKDLKELSLPLMGKLAGKVTLHGQSDSAGIDVYIPGTTYIAKTDSAGRFAFERVPVGEHNVFMERDGYHRGQAEAVEVNEGETTTLPDIDLLLSTGAEGFISIADGKAFSNTRQVKLTVGATPDAVLMKISESINFDDVSWKPISSTSTYTFATQGPKTLYIKFADANGLESSPFQDSVTVDLFSNEAVAFTPTFSVENTIYAPDHTFHLTSIVVPVHAVDMMITPIGSWDVATWEPAATSKEFPLSLAADPCGGYSFQIKFRDAEGFESASSAPVGADLKCWRDVPSVAFNGTFDTIHSLVSNGSSAYLWGGNSSGASAFLRAYDVGSNTWSALPEPIHTESAPPASFPIVHTRILATGTDVPLAYQNKLMLFGGGNPQTFGGMTTADFLVLDPAAGTPAWSAVAAGGSAPSHRSDAAVVLAGNKVVVWGGRYCGAQSCDSTRNDGAVFDLQTGNWSAINATGAPSARHSPMVAWSGSKVILFGGAISMMGGEIGALYDPVADTWTAMSTVNAPEARGTTLSDSIHEPAVWCGNRLVVWGGTVSNNGVNTGAMFDPVGNTWTTMAASGAPAARAQHTMACVNGKVLVMGGCTSPSPSCAAVPSAAVFDPAQNAWSPLPTGGTLSGHIHGEQSWSVALESGILSFGKTALASTYTFGLFLPF